MQLTRELDALALAAGERVERLAERQVPDADVAHRAQLLDDRRDGASFDDAHRTELDPLVFRRLYLSLFMFPGEHRLDREGARDALDGAYRELERAVRGESFLVCHSPDNAAKMSP